MQSIISRNIHMAQIEIAKHFACTIAGHSYSVHNQFFLTPSTPTNALQLNQKDSYCFFPPFLTHLRTARSTALLSYWHVVNLKDAMRVLQLKVPLFFKYWLVYQKVQSSVGSTLMLL